MQSSLVSQQEKAIQRASQALHQGRLVAFPTETVYGLGANAADAQAIDVLYRVKKRPRGNPLILHVGSLDVAKALAHLPEEAIRLATLYWPGPLTLVLRRRDDAPLADAVSSGGKNIALRIPDHPIALKLLAESGLAIAAPSANRSGCLSPTSAEDVLDAFGDEVYSVLDGGQCRWGVESTIVSCVHEPFRLLRPGALPLEVLQKSLGPHKILSTSNLQNESSQGGVYESPGLMTSHYAPRARVRLSARTVTKGEGLLRFGTAPVEGWCADHPTVQLSETADLYEAAFRLFKGLRILDRALIHTIAVMPIPNEGIGRAINDRLMRAAAPR